MDGITTLAILIILAVLLLPFFAMGAAASARREARAAKAEVADLAQRAAILERRVGRLVSQLESKSEEAGPVSAPAVEQKPVGPPRVPPVEAYPQRPQESRPPPAVPAVPVAAASHSAAPLRPRPPQPVPEVTARPKAPNFSIEQFMGVKMAAWLGGLALFFGVIFFVKYAFERELIPPAVRVALGFLTGIGLLVGGLVIHPKPKYRVLAQSLCATGVLVLYGVGFAAHAVYHFTAFSPPVTFGLMSLITAAAFLIALRLDALVVAVLGMIGGFLSPVLLPTVQDNVFALFSYIAVLDVGLLAVARHRKWSFLGVAAAVGTLLTMMGWHESFFVAEAYFEGAKTGVPMGILILFCLLFLGAAWRARRKAPEDLIPGWSAFGMGAAAMGFGYVYLTHEPIAGRPLLLYGFVLSLNLIAVGLAMIQPRLGYAQLAAAVATFFHLAVWTMTGLTPELLGSGLVIYLLFGALHAFSYPLVQRRLTAGGVDSLIQQIGPWFAPLVLLLILLTVFVLQTVPLFIWLAVFAVNLLVIGLAFTSGRVMPVVGSLILTVFVTGAWLMRMPQVPGSLMPLLAVIVLFGALFAAAGFVLGRRFGSSAVDRESRPLNKLLPTDLVSIFSGVLPFVLLIMAVLQLPIANPSPVFGVGLLLALLLLGLSLLARQPVLAPVALFCVLALEGIWHMHRFDELEPWIALGWYLGFYAIFTLFPFVFRARCAGRAEPWAASALSGVGHFLLVYELLRRSFPEQMAGIMGLVPVGFAIPSILALLALLRTRGSTGKVRQSQLAWFGGVALLFITLIFPIQFDRQWLTVSWALEGAALVWLFRRVPHPGLMWTGIALLTVAFARLALNPAIFTAYSRGSVPLLNWYLYAFGLVAAALIVAAWLLPIAYRRFGSLHLQGILYGFAGVLLFILLNIEIADFFTEPGATAFTFQFGGNFARDMAYSIGWGLFSLALLGLGIWRRAAPARIAAIGLLGVALLKVFVHDLSAIDNIYRIGALVGVAIIAFITSFLYQRFVSVPPEHEAEH